MDVEYIILNLYRTKQYEKCLKLCATASGKQNEKMIEFIRMRVVTIQSKLSSYAYEEVEYITDSEKNELTTTSLAPTPRPGTSFQKEATSMKKSSVTTLRSRAQTNVSRARSTSSALRTASRLSRAATALAAGVPFTSATPISLRFLTKDDKLFTSAAKTLFEYVYYCEGDVRKAMDIAIQAQKGEENKDWWWKYSLAKCYFALGMLRYAEDSLREALKQNRHISIYTRLVSIYVALNQPLSAMEICKQGLSSFPLNTTLLLEHARINDQMGNGALAVKDYRTVAVEDPSNVEAIASIAVYNFYNDQPEIALRYYRRLLATNCVGAEIFNNLGLCCLYCNQWDLIVPCFRQALYLSTDKEIQADIWFNLTHVALVNAHGIHPKTSTVVPIVPYPMERSILHTFSSSGDMILASRCLRICLALNSGHDASRKALFALYSCIETRNEQKYWIN